jgi:hypothetical protein
MTSILGGGGTSLLGNFSSSLLDVGKRLNSRGIGISASARAITNNFLSQSKSGGNQLLSLGLGSSSTIEGLQLRIKQLRSRYAPELIEQENATAKSTTKGTNVDKKV